ncbi:DUF6702 family protein [Aquimarina sp. 2201CG5-10]|uniref:DUF6702 family protein n=1 Tax=Aquimarina callyspongiae TaxID=3098150 RepID=UPI002AB4731D|nr:DUF6702 family protein [Aquimarina sp. 2201CG5-10]MDY8138630.1 DUF6702 family protein [Aquimarina sp. 2201CG5-10]
MKRIVVFVLCLALLPLTSFTNKHKFYVSVTQIDYNTEEQSLQIISRIFIDDIEEVLRKRYDEAIELGAKTDDTKTDDYLKRYLEQKLSVLVNGKEVRFSFLGKEYEDDLILCYLEVEQITALDTIEVSNQVLMDFFEEQQNIIHVKKGNQRKSLILEKEKETGMLKFSK